MDGFCDFISFVQLQKCLEGQSSILVYIIGHMNTFLLDEEQI